jgi:AcrR family transcriptional regulator
MPGRLTREQKKARTRAEVLAAARDVIARRGLDGASIDEIAERAGFSHGAIYSNFANKEALLQAVFEEFMRVRGDEIAGPLDERGYPDGVRQAALRWMERVSDDPNGNMLRLEFALRAWREPSMRPWLAHQLARNRDLIARMVEDGAESQGISLPFPASQLATIIRALGLGMELEKLVNPDAIPNELYADALIWILECAGFDSEEPQR